MTINIDFNELQLLWMWILSFFPECCISLQCNNNLSSVLTLIKKIDSDIHLVSFYRKYRDLKDTINQKYQLSSNSKILASNLFVKLPFVKIDTQNDTFGLI